MVQRSLAIAPARALFRFNAFWGSAGWAWLVRAALFAGFGLKPDDFPLSK